uniref:(California timema) hypothetical protein n=1 Tax=Timema californicum TaxID=61474 RepID=A0A7R9P7P3_TIMCA|nr:unnamed protein product [Timema californicum]
MEERVEQEVGIRIEKGVVLDESWNKRVEPDTADSGKVALAGASAWGEGVDLPDSGLGRDFTTGFGVGTQVTDSPTKPRSGLLSSAGSSREIFSPRAPIPLMVTTTELTPRICGVILPHMTELEEVLAWNRTTVRMYLPTLTWRPHKTDMEYNLAVSFSESEKQRSLATTAVIPSSAPVSIGKESSTSTSTDSHELSTCVNRVTRPSNPEENSAGFVYLHSFVGGASGDASLGSPCDNACFSATCSGLYQRRTAGLSLVGEVALIGSDNLKRLYWHLAVVEELYAGRDGIHRLVRLRTATRVIEPGTLSPVPASVAKLANALVVLSSTAEDGEIEVRISLANALVVLSSTAEDGEIKVRISFIGLASVAQATLSKGTSGNYISINLSFGFAVTLAILVAGGASGAHINPAVTVALTLVGKFPKEKLCHYLIAQYLGALVASVLVFLTYYEALAEFDGGERVVFGIKETASIWATYPKEFVSIGGCFFDQVVGTFILMFVVCAVTDNINMEIHRSLYALYIGITVIVLGMSVGYNCGYPLNPARDLSPRLFLLMAGWGKQAFLYRHYWWVGIVGPHIGAILGAFTYVFFIEAQLPKRELKPHDIH